MRSPLCFSPCDGVNICYEFYNLNGKGRTVVFIHSMRTNQRIWNDSVCYFVQKHDCKVVTFDLRGFGRSTIVQKKNEPNDENVFHPNHFGPDLIHLLDHLRIDYPVDVVCLALGGWAGLPSALENPERFRSLILCCSPGGLITDEIRKELDECDEREEMLMENNMDRNDFTSFFEDIELAPGFASRCPSRAMLYRDICCQNPGHPSFVNFDKLLRDVVVTPEIAKKLRVPTLVLIGKQDQAWSIKALEKVSELLGFGSRSHIKVAYIDAGHTAPFEKPDEFHDIVDNFFLSPQVKESCSKVRDFQNNNSSNKKNETVLFSAEHADFSKLIMTTEARKLSSGHGFTEGPIWHQDTNLLLFSDIPRHTIYACRLQALKDKECGPGAGGGTYGIYKNGIDTTKTTREVLPSVYVWREDTNFGNGNTIDRNGHILTCSHGSRRITRSKEPLSACKDRCTGVDVFVNATENQKKLTSPNDVIVESDGSVWFTDPDYGIDPDEGHGDKQETLYNGVYCVDSHGEISCKIHDLCRPNGLAFRGSDETTLYVADSGGVMPFSKFDSSLPRCVKSYHVNSDKSCTNPKTVVKVSEEGRRPDGLAYLDGKLYVCTAVGVEVYVENERKDESLMRRIGIIVTPEAATNCCFGGPNMNCMFITAGTAVWECKLLKENMAMTDAQKRVQDIANESKASALELIQKYKIDREELNYFIDYLHKLSDYGEWEDIFDVMGVCGACDANLYSKDLRGTENTFTPCTLRGPYYKSGAPMRNHLCEKNEPGVELKISGTVYCVEKNKEKVIKNAILEVWGANYQGLYDHEVSGGANYNLRGIVKCDANTGQYFFVTRLPGNYSLPFAGPTATFLKKANRTFVRAAHIHVIVKAPNCRTLCTQLYFDIDYFRDSDSVLAVHPNLTINLCRDNNNSGLSGKYDFRLLQCIKE